MSVLFSKVELKADNGNRCEFLACGIPQEETDFEDYTTYQDFVEENSETVEIEVDISSYVYGEGETEDANIYEIADFTKRGDDFLNHVDVQLVGKSGFMFMNNISDNGIEPQM